MKNEETLNILKYNHRVININLKDITHEQSLVSPDTGGNSLNWVLGHIIVSRNDINELIGIDKIADEKLVKLYDRGSANISGDNAEKIGKLIEIFNNSQQELENRVAEIDFSSDPEKMKSLTFLAFHEAYHCGQTGLLRRIAGKEGAIK